MTDTKKEAKAKAEAKAIKLLNSGKTVTGILECRDSSSIIVEYVGGSSGFPFIKAGWYAMVDDCSSLETCPRYYHDGDSLVGLGGGAADFRGDYDLVPVPDESEELKRLKKELQRRYE